VSFPDGRHPENFLVDKMTNTFSPNGPVLPEGDPSEDAPASRVELPA